MDNNKKGHKHLPWEVQPPISKAKLINITEKTPQITKGKKTLDMYNWRTVLTWVTLVASISHFIIKQCIKEQKKITYCLICYLSPLNLLFTTWDDNMSLSATYPHPITAQQRRDAFFWFFWRLNIYNYWYLKSIGIIFVSRKLNFK